MNEKNYLKILKLINMLIVQEYYIQLLNVEFNKKTIMENITQLTRHLIHCILIITWVSFSDCVILNFVFFF